MNAKLLAQFTEFRDIGGHSVFLMIICINIETRRLYERLKWDTLYIYEI
jgi:hypothetical protein